MHALITGGAGFIGSHLADHLVDAGHSVTVIDNLTTGRLANIRHLLERREFRIVAGSVQSTRVLERLVRRCDVIYHLAAAVGVRWIVEHPLLSIRTNLDATEVVLEQAGRYGKPVLLASTSEVYGKNDSRALREEDDSIIGSTQVTRWLYANSKAMDEFLALAHHRERGVPVVIVRFFNVVGTRQTGDYGMVVPRFVEAALRGEPLLIHGDGRQTRCFTDVHDAVRAVISLAQTREAIGEVFNVGCDREITIEDLALTVIRLTGSSSDVRFVPYQEAYPVGFEDMRRRVPDLTKLKRTIGFVPDTRLEQSLLRIIDHCRSRLTLAPDQAAKAPATAPGVAPELVPSLTVTDS